MNSKQITLTEQLKFSEQITKDIFDISAFSRPNSKRAYLKLGAKIQANTLAFKEPEIKFKNSNVQEIWDKISKSNRFLEIVQQLESNLYEFGYYALGISKIDNNDFKISLAKVENYKFFNNKLIKLSIVIDSFSDNNENYEIIKEYDLTQKVKPFIPLAARNKLTKSWKSLDEFKKYNFEYLNEVAADFIPWILIKNNYLGNSEIEDVDQSLFQMLDNSLECVLRDNFWSNPFIFILDNYNTGSADDIKNSIYDLGKRVISSSSMTLNSQIGNPIEFHQGNSNTNNILQKIDKLNYLIKDQMFFKMNSADFGTKNMHNAEFENLNSNFNDYVESKANSRESYYYDFITLFLKQANLTSDFEIIVPNSTKYLKSSEAIYNTDINGVVLNQTNKQAEVLTDEVKHD
ncbi:hypothetical protein JPM7_2060 [Metamycoplasma equirhinis]|uniref:hypothetical protein n=1 Tax=Metamycoplasma equirhinis TaxID=92402 RepID=UPI0025736A2E|nr:hypothetical protein [Metamycoplasma equirhinis]BDX52599.1 hypothetical protein JPM7_2060 [Metamycoplasma equirhinis]